MVTSQLDTNLVRVLYLLAAVTILSLPALKNNIVFAGLRLDVSYSISSLCPMS